MRVRMHVIASLLFAFACERPQPPDVATATHTADETARALAPPPAATPRPPPPPPPPPESTPQPPPARVAAFLRAHAGDAAPWRASYGRRGARTRLTATDAAELARRLARDESYVDGDYGCVAEPIEYELARGDAKLVFRENCGHMQLGDEDHAALFSSEMVTFLQRVRR